MILKIKKNVKLEAIHSTCDSIRNAGIECYFFRSGQDKYLITSSLYFDLDEIPLNKDLIDSQINLNTLHQVTSRAFHPDDTNIIVNGETIGADDIHIIAGPCAVESRSQAFDVATELKREGIHLFRGGIFKPRTSPYTFQGLGKDGIPILAEIKESLGLSIISEALNEKCLESLIPFVDIIQIGSRNMQNFSLLKEVGSIPFPIFLKRGMAATIKEFLLAAEYIMLHGNPNIILCERGIRTFDEFTRYTLDLSSVPFLKKETHLPVFVDPSHGTGNALFVRAMSRAAIAAGADGIMVEVHPNPQQALSDGFQSIDYKEFKSLINDVEKVGLSLGKKIFRQM